MRARCPAQQFKVRTAIKQRLAMALQDVEYVVIVLCSVLVLLIAVFAVVFLIYLRRRRLFCFKRDAAARPYAIPDRRIEAGLAKQETKKKQFLRQKRKPRYKPLDESPPVSKKDPFAKALLENPIVNPDELEQEDWSNPAFDRERAVLFDAAVAIQSWYRMASARMRYLEIREAVIFCQALYRGYKVRRMLPRLRREKQLRDQKKKQGVWKKKGTLSSLKFYEVKGYGFAEVEQLYGLETTRNAADQLKKLYGGKGKMRLKLFISIKGIKLFEYYGMSHFATVKVSSVSFCTLDPRNKKIFAFINRKKKRNFCHVFQASEQDAQKMVETMAEAFEVTFKKLEEKREQQYREKVQHERETRLARLKKQAFHRQSQELDVEVESMMEMAETATQLTTVELHPSPPDSPLAGSRERLLLPAGLHHPHNSRKNTRASGLLLAQKPNSSPSTSEPNHTHNLPPASRQAERQANPTE